MRTFITEDKNRNEMVQHVYDITYGTVRPGQDTLVVIDDSIVRGTTLKRSIIRMLARLQPKKDHHRFLFPPDTLPRLLRYRHEQDGRFYRVQCRRCTDA
jgi:glutamine phosphoribosylpyrophosphate amidotransferase